MSRSVVLLCSRAGFAAEPPPGARVIDELCHRPAAAATALRKAGATRAVLGLCRRRPSSELLAALRRAGAEPFGIETVELAGRTPAAAALALAAAQARLAVLPAGERGRTTLRTGAISRRTLFSVRGALAHAPTAALDEQACAGSARCGLCLDACPAGAISGGAPTPVIDVNACDACGLCVARCPQGALRLTGASTSQVEAQLDRVVGAVEGVVLGCAAAEAAAPSGWALVELPTLGLVTAGWLLQLHARGVDVRLAPCDGPCCAGVTAVEECVRLAVEELGPPNGGSPGQVRLTEPAATADGVRALAPPARRRPIVAEGSPLGILALDSEQCTLCSACANVCPTGALRFDETADETVLWFTAAACVACGRCVGACPEHTIAVERGVDLERLDRAPLALARAVRERCRDCGADLPPAPMRRRLRGLVTLYAGAPPDLCAGCAAKAQRTTVLEGKETTWQPRGSRSSTRWPSTSARSG